MKTLFASTVSAIVLGIFLASMAHGQLIARPNSVGQHKFKPLPGTVTSRPGVVLRPSDTVHNAAAGGLWNKPLTPAPDSGGGAGGAHTQTGDATAPPVTAKLTLVSLECIHSNDNSGTDEVELRVYFGMTEPGKERRTILENNTARLSWNRTIIREARVELWEEDDFPDTDDNLGRVTIRIADGFGAKEATFNSRSPDGRFTTYKLKCRLDP